MKISEVKEAMDELTYMSSDPETRAVYDARVRELNDIYSGQTTRYKEGLAEGIEKGRAEGIEKGRAEERAKAEAEKHAEKTEMAKKLLDIGLTASQVSETTGLPIEEIAALKEDICAE